MNELRDVRVFVASPDDVPHERGRVERVVARLNSELGTIAHVHAVRWEHAFYKAHQTYQVQIREPADCDVVIVIFANKLGSELPADFPKKLPDGSAYPSGTAYELLSAVAAAERDGKPDVYVFRKTAELQFKISQQAEIAAAWAEKARLDGFFETWFRTPEGGFRRALQWFADTDAFDDQVERLLRQWVAQSLLPSATWTPPAEGSPFRGLEPFDARHSRFFFGRDRKVSRAIEELLRAQSREAGRPFLLVVGPSGSGKSSLVRAGVIPRLTAPGSVADVDLWRVAVMRPGGGATVFAAMAQALFGSDDDGGFGAALPELRAGPFRSAADLAGLLQAAPPAAVLPVIAALDSIATAEQQTAGFVRPVRTRLLLLVDQLEEIFAKRVDDADRIGFARLLTLLAETGRVWVIATLRADLYAEMLDQASPFLALKDSGGAYDLSSPSEAELREILEKSAKAANLAYDQEPGGERLDDILLRDATGADALPLLQFSLKELYERRGPVQTPLGPRTGLTAAAYSELGGLDGAIDKVAEAAVKEPAQGFTETELDALLPPLLRRLAEQVRENRATTSGQVALTTREVKLAEVSENDRARALIDVLVRARLLVYGNDSRHDASIRLAHERVLTSWARARKIVQEHRGFFLVMADIEMEWQRWLAGGQRRELLLTGLPLQEAEATLRRYGNELPADLRRYVTLGGRRKRRIKRLAIAGVAGVSLVAVLATAFGILAYSAEQTAAGNYAAAKRAADGLVASIPKSLQKKRNIEDDTLDIMFNLAGKMIDEIQAPDSDRGGYVARQLQAGFAIAQRLLRGDGAAPDESIALARSRANMLYEFAETYHRSANNLKRATELARDSLAIRQTLVQTGDASPQARAAVAMAQMELGDLLRRSIEMDPANHNRKNAAPADFASVRALFDPALATLEALHLLDPANREWALGDSKILTDRGDLYRKDGDFANAGALYARAQAVTLQVFSADTPDAKAVSELAWTYRKLGEVHAAKQERHPAAQAFSDEVCVRRWAASLDPNDPSYDEDLGYALAELGDALSRMDPPDHTAARDAFFEALVGWAILQEGNQSNPKFYDRFVDMLGKIGAEYRAEGQMDLSETFRRAAADVAANIALVFVQNTDAWTDQANRPSLLTQQTRLRNDGPFHMINIEGDRRQTIDNIRLEFVVGRLHDLRAGARGCWNRLTQGPMKQAASSIP